MRILLLFCCVIFMMNGMAQVRFGNAQGDSVLVTNNPDLAIVYKNGKQGLYNAQLNKYVLPQSGRKLFYSTEFDVLIKAEKNGFSVLNLSDENPFLLEKSYKFSHVFMISKNAESREFRMIIDGQNYYLNLDATENLQWKQKVIPQQSIKCTNQLLFSHTYFGLTVLVENRVILTCFSGTFYDPNTLPLRSLVYPDEDSLIQMDYGWYAVYPGGKDPVSGSGVYDLALNKWLIAPNNWAVYKRPDGYLIQLGLTEANNYEYRYTFMDEDFNIVFAHQTIQEIIREYDYLKHTIPIEKFDTVYALNSQNEQRDNTTDSEENHTFLKVESGGKQILLDWSLNYSVNGQTILTKPKDFIHFNQEEGFYLWFNNDSVFCEYKDRIMAADAKDEEVIIFRSHEDEARQDLNGYESFSISEGSDTTWFVSTLKSYYEVLNYKFMQKANGFEWYASIKRANGFIVLNDFRAHPEKELENLTPDASNNQTSYLQTEKATIWSKEHGFWNEVTVNYAKIQPLPFGYLVATSPQIKLGFFGDNREGIEGGYVVLNRQLKAIAYMDYFDFRDAEIYPFGVKLCIDKGCFLVDNNGKALTDALFTSFELEEERIKGWREEVEVIDQESALKSAFYEYITD